ncbi:hypothetical protein [Alteromonas oceanisediminis]|uniref:hypothetical protein n=1 Tax=Alteromonas oceanisediminis TaxID=2836180 RepID=UPI001BD9EFBF|nr:hypothetical protein [Alteromonas oceanisediminis]MBT0584811.1 hypothetical protein [Alteromonas oceanisediminis]
MKSFSVLVLIIALHLGYLNFTYAASQDSKAAFDALEMAQEDLQQRKLGPMSDYTLMFLQHEQNKHGDYQLARITQRNGFPVKSELLRSKGEVDKEADVNWNRFILVTMPREYTQQAKLVRETEASWYFQVPTTVQAQTDSEEIEELSHANKLLQERLVTEVSVSKLKPSFTGMRIFAPQPFSPSLLVKVTTFDVKLDFDEVSSSGPLYVSKETRQLEGHYGLFISINDWVQTTITDMQIMERQKGFNNHDEKLLP